MNKIRDLMSARSLIKTIRLLGGIKLHFLGVSKYYSEYAKWKLLQTKVLNRTITKILFLHYVWILERKKKGQEGKGNKGKGRWGIRRESGSIYLKEGIKKENRIFLQNLSTLWKIISLTKFVNIFSPNSSSFLLSK